MAHPDQRAETRGGALMRCTGACCKAFTLSATRAEIRRVVDDTRQDQASRVDAAKIWALVREIPGQVDEFGWMPDQR